MSYSKFFTNEGDNKLLARFAGVFEHAPIRYFDVLVGFFYSSGYFLIRPHIEKINQIRILVGMDADEYVAKAYHKGLLFRGDEEKAADEFLSKLKKDIQSSEYKKEVEEGILQFIQDVVTSKVEVRTHPSKKIHAKIYIFRPEAFNEFNSGEVITGSSNLTESGLGGKEFNYEFNVALRDFNDVKFATTEFERLWTESSSILPKEIEAVKNETYISNSFSPYEVYIKFLIEYFGAGIEYDPESKGDMPIGFKQLKYQVDAITDGFQKLSKHNGFILADVVGLGKTAVATQIARKFYYSNGYRTKILIVHPPLLKSNWEETIRAFDVQNVSYVNNQSLHKIKHPEDYDLIIVDEAHKFRSDESQMFDLLQRLCKTSRKIAAPDGSKVKKIILVSATPLNNHPKDIRNLLYLFLDSKNSSLDIGNIQHFFRPLIDDYDKLKKPERKEDGELKSFDKRRYMSAVKKIYDEIRIKAIEPVIVRRTRTDIRESEDYWEDLVSQGYAFPEIMPPHKVLYLLNDSLDQLYDETIRLTENPSKGLGYYRYRALQFLPKNISNKLWGQRGELLSQQLADIMRVLLVKRLDSSFHAFKKTLGRYQRANSAMLKMIEANRIFIAPKLKVNDLVHSDNTDALEEALLNIDDPSIITAFSTNEFENEFIEGIKKDQSILDDLVKRWEEVGDYDPKLDEFEKRLKSEIMDPDKNDNHKLVVFSESKETSQYLRDQLEIRGFKRILEVDSSNKSLLQETIAKNFDANYLHSKQENEIDILITTEVLAEGVNLHRSNTVVNYDIPWNTTRLMQRIGRVNRIGTKSKFIHVYNFFPTARTDNEIELNKKAFLKLQAFHTALGEDSQIYSTEEEFGTFGLFEKLPQEERDERLIYLEEIRKFRSQNPEYFKKIKNQIPLRARVGRKDPSRMLCTVTFIKNNKRDCFYYIKPDSQYEELTFIQAARIFKAYGTERGIPLHELHHEQIQASLRTFINNDNVIAAQKNGYVHLGPNEKQAIGQLHLMMKEHFVGEQEKELLLLGKIAIEHGKFQKLPRAINALLRKQRKEGTTRLTLYQEVIKVLNGFPLQKKEADDVEFQDSNAVNQPNRPRIIISESFN